MRRWLPPLVLFMLVVCGCGLETFPFSSRFLSLEVGGVNGLHAVAGSTSYVYVTVVGAGDRPITFQGTRLPEFATLSADGLLTLQPPLTVIGEFDFTLSVTVGDESASKNVHLSVSRDNTPPSLSLYAEDSRGLHQGEDVGNLPWDCLSPLYIEATAIDLDRDPAGLEVRATPMNDPSAQAISLSTPMQEAGGYNGTYISFYRREGRAVQLPSLTPGVAWSVAVRAVDALGGTSDWMSLHPITCYPFGVNLPGNDWRIGTSKGFDLKSGTSSSASLLVEGSSTQPIVLTLENPPSFVRLNGTTLSFEAPVVKSSQVFRFTVLATSAGMTAKVVLQLIVNP